jgi:hypothetical protein
MVTRACIAGFIRPSQNVASHAYSRSCRRPGNMSGLLFE